MEKILTLKLGQANFGSDTRQQQAQKPTAPMPNLRKEMQRRGSISRELMNLNFTDDIGTTPLCVVSWCRVFFGVTSHLFLCLPTCCQQVQAADAAVARMTHANAASPINTMSPTRPTRDANPVVQQSVDPSMENTRCPLPPPPSAKNTSANHAPNCQNQSK